MRKCIKWGLLIILLSQSLSLGGWVSPTGFNDPDTQWTNETNTYDNNTGSYAYDNVDATSWSSYLELTRTATVCDKIRYHANYIGSGHQIDVDVYYESAWHDVYQGAYSDDTWEEKSIPDGTKTVTAARVRIYNSSGGSNTEKFNEFDFNETTLAEADEGHYRRRM